MIVHLEQFYSDYLGVTFSLNQYELDLTLIQNFEPYLTGFFIGVHPRLIVGFVLLGLVMSEFIVFLYFIF
jgi:hypothetical protein